MMAIAGVVNNEEKRRVIRINWFIQVLAVYTCIWLYNKNDTEGKNTIFITHNYILNWSTPMGLKETIIFIF